MNISTSPIQYVIYARKSTEELERQAISIDSQKDKANELARSRDLSVHETISESRSAFEPEKRPEFNRMLKLIDDGSIQGIIAWHPDRLSRNELEAAAITYRIRIGRIKSLVFASYTFDNSPEGMMMLQMTMSQSQYSSAKLSNDVKRGNSRKLTLGWKPGQAPWGYLNTPDLEKGLKIIIRDPDRFELVKKLWQLMLTGNYTIPQLHRLANDEWKMTRRPTKKYPESPISISGINRVFKNPFYCGILIHNGDEYQGSHDAMISREEFNHVQSILGRNGLTRPKSYNYTFKGPFTCGECGSQITAEQKSKYIKSTNTVSSYIYYHCTHSKPCSQRKSISETELKRVIDEQLAQITILPEFQAWALETLNKHNDLEIANRQQVQENSTVRISKIQRELDSLTQMRYRELINDDEYLKEKSKLIENLESARNQSNEIAERASNWLELTEKTFEYATYARHKFNNSTDTQELLEIFSTLSEGFRLVNGVLEYDLHKWFIPIQESYQSLEVDYQNLRTRKFTSIKEKTTALAVVKSQWLRGRDSNPRPIGYIYPHLSKRNGLSHHPLSWSKALPTRNVLAVLPEGIVSEPSLKGLGCGLPYNLLKLLRLPAIHLVFTPWLPKEAALYYYVSLGDNLRIPIHTYRLLRSLLSMPESAHEQIAQILSRLERDGEVPKH